MVLKCYPVCECGYVLKELKITRQPITQIKRIESFHAINNEIMFYPYSCPNCKEVISSLEIKKPSKLAEIDFN